MRIPETRELIRAAMTAHGWDSRDLRRELALRGIRVSRQAVGNWRAGANVADAHREALSDALGIDFALLCRALARRAAGRPA